MKSLIKWFFTLHPVKFAFILSILMAVMIVPTGLWATAMNRSMAALNTLLLILDSDSDGSITDETWYQTFAAKQDALTPDTDYLTPGTVASTYIPKSDLLDEDDMASNSATKPLSQQSAKNYTDNQVATKADASHASQHEFGGADPINQMCEGVTIQTFGDDATPDVSDGGSVVYPCWQVYDGTPAAPITDFDDGDDHSEFSTGNWFWMLNNNPSTFDLSDNSNLEGNCNVDPTGSASQQEWILWQFVKGAAPDTGHWIATNLNSCKKTPTQFGISSIQAHVVLDTDADGIVLTSGQLNMAWVMTGAGDVDIPENQCDTATGNWLSVKSTDTHLNSITSNDASDQFILPDGTALTAGNELDLAGAAGSQVTVVCLQAHKWWVTGEIGTCVDGGAAD